MVRSRPIQLAALAGLGLLGSCSREARSCDLQASAIVLYATVTDGDDGVEVEIELETGLDEGDSIGTPLSLCSEAGERLEVNGSLAEQVRVLGHVYYVVEFDDPQSSYVIDFVRDEGTITAELAMPPTFEIGEPAEDAVIARSEPIPITWSPTWPEHTISLAIEDRIGSDCLAGLGYTSEVDDLGGVMVGANQLETGASAKADDTCKAWIALTRSSVAPYPEALHEGGSIEGYVKRRRRFRSSG
ncbi:hypothetical protein ACNOYE_09630 [Nannocystaceae bacterium ST9]